MKKVLFTLLFFTITSTVFTGCKKDDDENNGGIEGTWKSTKDVWYIIANGVKGQEYSENHSEDEVDFLILSGGKYTVKDADGDIDSEGTYTYSNGKLIIDDGEYEFEVKLSGNSLVIGDKYEFTEGGQTVVEVDETYYVRQ